MAAGRLMVCAGAGCGGASAATSVAVASGLASLNFPEAGAGAGRRGRHEGFDLHRRGHAGDELDPLRDLIDVDAHRHPLREPHEGEDRVDRSKPGGVGSRVRHIDAAREPLNAAFKKRGISHELDRRGVAFPNPPERGLLEIGVDPERVRIDDRELKRADIGIVPELCGEIGDIAVDGRADLGACEVDPRLREIRERRLVGRLGVGRLADIGLPLLHRHRDVVELLAPDHFGVGVVGDRSRLLDRRLRLPDGDRIVPGIDQHQKIALVDELVVGDRQLHDLASDLGGDLDDIGADRPVARPGRAHVVLPRCIAERGRDADGDHGDENRRDAERRQDRAAPGRRPSGDVGAFQDVVGFQLDAGHQLPQRAMTRTIDETMIT